MNIEDTIGAGKIPNACAVCGKNVEGNRGFARVSHDGIMLNLCCPGCMEAFRRDPATYAARLLEVQTFLEMKRLNVKPIKQ